MKSLINTAIVVMVLLSTSAAQAQFTPQRKTRGTSTAGEAMPNSTRAQGTNQQRALIVQMTRQALAQQAQTMRQTRTTPQVAAAITNYAPASTAARSYGQGGDSCETAIAAAERKYRLPPYLLHAIALTESGQNNRPYPYAMNIMGQGYYARSIEEMVNVVMRYGAGSSIDVGCVQVNLRYHGRRFSDWRTLLYPTANAEYAAYHLLELFREKGSWSAAVGAYHSRTPWRGANYACLVSRRYGQIFGANRTGCGPDINMMTAYLYRTIGTR